MGRCRSTYLEPGTKIKTDVATSAEASEEVTPTETIYKTILTGADLKSASVAFDNQTGTPEIAFVLNADGAKIFADHTANNINKYLAIALDKVIISCPRINSAIRVERDASPVSSTDEVAQSMVLQLRYGSLPVPLKVIDTRGVGPTLGQDSVQKSVRAGVIGLIIVLLFMLIYYRLPGFLADLALIIYALLTLAVFKLIPVTLTLPGIAGFLLSVGMAVVANILIFERMREELRQGAPCSGPSNRLSFAPGLPWESNVRLGSLPPFDLSLAIALARVWSRGLPSRWPWASRSICSPP
jgi:preprotein translocase subunit SecD